MAGEHEQATQTGGQDGEPQGIGAGDLGAQSSVLADLVDAIGKFFGAKGASARKDRRRFIRTVQARLAEALGAERAERVSSILLAEGAPAMRILAAAGPDVRPHMASAIERLAALVDDLGLTDVSAFDQALQWCVQSGFAASHAAKAAATNDPEWHRLQAHATMLSSQALARARELQAEADERRARKERTAAYERCLPARAPTMVQSDPGTSACDKCGLAMPDEVTACPACGHQHDPIVVDAPAPADDAPGVDDSGTDDSQPMAAFGPVRRAPSAGGTQLFMLPGGCVTNCSSGIDDGRIVGAARGITPKIAIGTKVSAPVLTASTAGPMAAVQEQSKQAGFDKALFEAEVEHARIVDDIQARGGYRHLGLLHRPGCIGFETRADGRRYYFGGGRS